MQTNTTLGLKYKVLELLSNDGATSEVYRVQEIITSQYYAAKIFEGVVSDKIFREEVDTLRLMENERVIKFMDYGTDVCPLTCSKRNYIIMELAFSKTLMELVTEMLEDGEYFKTMKPFNEEQGKQIFMNMLKALNSCHQKGYQHGDIKPDNFLINNQYHLVLADFGYATKLKTKDLFSAGYKGTAAYMAPEVRKCEHSYRFYKGINADYYSLAITTLALLTGKIYASKAKNEDEHNLFFKDKFEKLQLDGFSEQFIDLMRKLVSFKPDKRPSYQEIIEHEWLRDIKINEQELQREFELRMNVIMNH